MGDMVSKVPSARAAVATADQVWDWLDAVPDPEIPVISIVDLGIVRDVTVDGGACVVAVTPTYSGCPAMAAIAQDIAAALQGRGFAQVRIERRLSPAWTTDWMSAAGKAALRGYGIAPPERGATVHVIDTRPLARGAAGGERAAPVACPQCGSPHTRRLSEFGSTPCKALHQCLDCREPFDYFKPH